MWSGHGRPGRHPQMAGGTGRQRQLSGAPAIRPASVLWVPAWRGDSRRQSLPDAGGPAPRPSLAENSLSRRYGGDDRRGGAPSGKFTRRKAPALYRRDALCGGPAGFRTGGIAAGGGARQGRISSGQGERGQGTFGANGTIGTGGGSNLSGYPRRIPAEEFAARRALSVLFARQGRLPHPPAVVSIAEGTGA